MDPLTGVRVLVAGRSPVLDAAHELLELLGAEPIVVDPRRRWPDGFVVDGALVVDPPSATDPWPSVLVGTGDGEAEWERLGLNALSDPPRRPVGPFSARLTAAAAVASLIAAARGRALALSGPRLLGERAALTRIGRATTTAAGGSARMVRAADGWVAINLARPDDLAALPALVGAAVDPADWVEMARRIARLDVAELVATADLLGLPLAAVGSVDETWAARGQRPVRSPLLVDGARPGRSGLRPSGARPEPVADPLVVELASLWAGPLCGRILADAGCRVVKVESQRRPDGARRGPRAFFDLLNADKESVAVDLATPAGRDLLGDLLARADVVIEGSRPRALDALGLGPDAPGPRRRVWVSITGHGRFGPGANRVAFGDDAAVAGGLWTDDPPRFLLDAAADPIAGLYAAVGALAGLVSGRGHLVDVAMREAVAYALGGATRWEVVGDEGGRPAPTERAGRAADLGFHTTAWRAELA